MVFVETKEESVGGTGSSSSEHAEQQNDSTGTDRGKRAVIQSLEQQIAEYLQKIDNLEKEIATHDQNMA